MLTFFQFKSTFLKKAPDKYIENTSMIVMASLGKVFTVVTIFHRQNMVSPVMSLVTIVRWVDNALAKVYENK